VAGAVCHRVGSWLMRRRMWERIVPAQAAAIRESRYGSGLDPARAAAFFMLDASNVPPRASVGVVALGIVHRRRLREVYRSAGWPCQDPLEVELLAAGLIERVRGGTVVLEDASSLSPTLRAQLSRVGLTRLTQRVGDADSLPADVRLILVVRTGNGATQGVDELLRAFNAMVIDVPQLRERRSDIPQLVHHFRRRFAQEQGTELRPVSADDMLPLLGREWTGNVRELEHWVERAALAARAESGAHLAGIEFGEAQATLEQLERAYILHVLSRENGHQSRTAERLGIDRRTLYRKLKQYRLEAAARS